MGRLLTTFAFAAAPAGCAGRRAGDGRLSDRELRGALEDRRGKKKEAGSAGSPAMLL